MDEDVQKVLKQILTMLRTSPRRSKVDSLAGHWPVIPPLCYIRELSAATAIVLIRGITVTLIIELPHLQRLLRTGPWKISS